MLLFRECFIIKLIITVFLQRCVLRGQDFAIFHREYIRFESPDEIDRTLSSGFYIRIGPDSIRTQKSVRNLIVTKTKTSEQK